MSPRDNRNGTDLVVDVALEGELEGALAFGQGLGEREGGGRQLEVERDGGRLERLSGRRRPGGGGRDEGGFHDVDLLAVEGHAAGLLDDLRVGARVRACCARECEKKAGREQDEGKPPLACSTLRPIRRVLHPAHQRCSNAGCLSWTIQDKPTSARVDSTRVKRQTGTERCEQKKRRNLNLQYFRHETRA